MAARKSCTHLTWAEAKSKVGGGGGGSSTNTKSKQDSKKIKGGVTHDKILAAKIISKQQQGSTSQEEQIANRQAARRARRDQEYAAALEQRRQEEKEQRRLESLASTQPFDQAREQMKQLALELLQQQEVEEFKSIDIGSRSSNDNGIGENDDEKLTKIMECKQLQLEEIMSLEAIYDVDDSPETLFICKSSQIDKLRDLFSKLEDGPQLSRTNVLHEIAHHPPLSFLLQLQINKNDDDDIVACVLLQITFPPFYPLGYAERMDNNINDNHCQLTTIIPTFEIKYCMITNKTMIVSCNKPLESLGYIKDEPKLIKDMRKEAQQILSDPCSYEIASSFLPQHLFDYIE